MRSPSCCLGALALLLPQPLAAQDTREFGAATFVPPAGWSFQSQPPFQIYSRLRGRDRCLLIVSAEESSPPDFAGAFTTAWRAIFSSGYRRAEQPASVERVSPTGVRHAVGEGEVEDGAGNHLVARLLVVPTGSGSQWIVLIGNGRPAFAGCGADWDAFYRSLRFRSISSDSGAPARGAAAIDSSPAAPWTGEPTRFGNLIFVPPRGWLVRRVGDVMQLSATGTRGPEKLDVLLLPGRASAADLERELEITWGEVQRLMGADLLRNVSGRFYDRDEPGRSLAGVEYLKGNGGMRTAGGEWDVSVYLLRAGERIERVVVIARAFTEQLSRVTTANSPLFSGDIHRLVFGMRFANQPERPVLRAGLTPGGIVGVWAGLGMSFGSIKTEFAVFFDNGLAYFGSGFPLQGLHEVDPVAEQPEHRRDWGSYTWSGGSGVLTMPYGGIPLRSTGSGLELTTSRTVHRYIRLVLPPGLRLDGSWCYSEGQCLRFMPDGRFADTGAVRVAEHSVYAWPQAPAGGTGRYRLQDHTLYLTYEAGPELRIAFPGVEDGSTSSPNRLRLGWNADLLTRH